MISKYKLSLIAVVFLALVAAYAQGPRPAAPTNTGRFQLYQFEYYVEAKPPIKFTAVFRIDTETGATARYASGLDNGGRAYSFWQQIDEPTAQRPQQ